MMSQCPVCGKVKDYGPPYLVKNGTIQATKIECKSCKEKRIQSKWKYSKIYVVTVLQKGVPGRRSGGDRRVPIWFTPSIPILPRGNQDYIYADADEHESELRFIRKGTRIKLSFFWDEYGTLRIRNIGV